MHYTIERLIAGDEDVADHFMAANDRWKGLLQNIDEISVEDLAKQLGSEQMWFEANCGGRWPGQEVMAWTAFASIYNSQTGWDGHESRGVKLAQAFEKSMVSIEVKGEARTAAKSYYVEVK